MTGKPLDRLNYESVEGDGRSLVFVHGWLGSMKSWYKVREKLDLDNPMLFFDQRCHGGSEAGDFDLEDLAVDLDSLITQEGYEDPVLIGHSMGGMVALKYLTAHRELDCILFGTSASTPEPRNRSPSYFLEKYGKLDERRWAEMITSNYVGEEEVSENEDSIRQLMEADPKAVRSGLRSMIGYDVREELERIDVESTVIHGRKDGAITRPKSEELAELLDAELKTLEASHLMISEKPFECSEIIENFLNRN